VGWRQSLNNSVTGGVAGLSIGISTASQLPGRGLGGPADVLRHLILSAEMTRRFGPEIAQGLLNAHEAEDSNPAGIDTAHDQYINSIGISIGRFATPSATTAQIVDLCYQALEGSFSGFSWRDAGANPLGSWQESSGGYWLPPISSVRLFLGDRSLAVPPLALTPSEGWEQNPRDINGIPLSNDLSNWSLHGGSRGGSLRRIGTGLRAC
jgi:hypothetical protein